MFCKKAMVWYGPLLIIIALIGHVLSFNTLPLQYDELLMHELISKNSIIEIMLRLFGSDFQMPLSYILSKSVGSIWGNDHVALRMPSLVLTFLSAYFFFRLARLKLNFKDSIRSTILLLLFHPVFIFSASFRPYMLLIFFSITGLYYFRIYIDNVESSKNLKFLILNLILLSLSHMAGVFFAITLASIVLIQKSQGRQKNLKIFLSMVFFLVVIFWGLRWKDLLHLSANSYSLNSYQAFFYKLSFVTSGREFTTIFCGLLAFALLSKKSRGQDFKIDNINLLILVGAVFIVAAVLPFIEQYFQPRHLVFCLPLIALMTVDLINFILKNEPLKNVIYGLMFLVLLNKSFVREKIYSVPYEIDSSGLATKAMEISNNQLPILSCGNCFSYYIKSEKLNCIHTNSDHFENADNEIVYIELNYVKKICGINNLNEKFRILENHPFVGGSVYRLTFK